MLSLVGRKKLRSAIFNKTFLILFIFVVCVRINDLKNSWAKESNPFLTIFAWIVLVFPGNYFNKKRKNNFNWIYFLWFKLINFFVIISGLFFHKSCELSFWEYISGRKFQFLCGKFCWMHTSVFGSMGQARSTIKVDNRQHKCQVIS